MHARLFGIHFTFAHLNCHGEGYLSLDCDYPVYGNDGQLITNDIKYEWLYIRSICLNIYELDHFKGQGQEVTHVLITNFP